MPNEFAKRLRRDQTDAERLLWARLRDRQLNGYKFRRQRPIERYVVDFVCIERRLVVELDGGQHAEQMSKDDLRTAEIVRRGFRVIRFWNNDVIANIEGVLEAIAVKLSE